MQNAQHSDIFNGPF